MIEAQHKTRLDLDGNPQRKKFTEDAWNSIPGVWFADKNGITKESKGGWVIVGNAVQAPTPLRKKVETTPKTPATPTAPVTEPVGAGTEDEFF